MNGDSSQEKFQQAAFQQYRIQSNSSDSDDEHTNMAQEHSQMMMATMQAMVDQMKMQQEQLMALQQQVVRSKPKIKPVQPDLFRGARSSSVVEAWLHTVDKYCDCFPEMDDLERVTYASTLFRDSAATWWRHLETSLNLDDGSNMTPKTWRDFQEAFRAEFKPRNSAQVARSKLRRLSQDTVPSKTIHEYVIKFRDIMLDLPHMDDEDAIHEFVMGLSYEARMQVLLKEHTSLTDAFNAAEHFEAVQEYAMGLREDVPATPSDQPHASAQPSHQGPTPMDIDAIQHRHFVPRSRQPHGFNQYRSPRGGRTCYNCGGRNHLARQCPSPREGESRGQQAKSQAGHLKGQARLD
ncbi:predicted protein [Lichtheimia corymbifera JMRC:FSU:9682]|uniref:CCHC-type domain-containing protein n=1 Tax=Lichtheimia corymbifera JMRC:FSU:9682 TaxID=1263082 RepID=A0A068SH37_9FUNG|nr:predicted protein [Lichtheimia corymbifera JMRC:FSU:9682]